MTKGTKKYLIVEPVTKRIIEYGYHADDVLASIDLSPKLDYAPVKHGEWVKDHSYTRKNFELYYCTVCNHWQKCSIKTPSMNVLHMKYCPSCGAKMDGGEAR